MITNLNGTASSDDLKLLWFHNTRDNPKEVVCIKDNPPMVGFGKNLKCGDKVLIEGTVHNEIGFAVTVPSECAFYAYDYFEPCDDFFNS